MRVRETGLTIVIVCESHVLGRSELLYLHHLLRCVLENFFVTNQQNYRLSSLFL